MIAREKYDQLCCDATCGLLAGKRCPFGCYIVHYRFLFLNKPAIPGSREIFSLSPRFLHPNDTSIPGIRALRRLVVTWACLSSWS